MKESNIQKEIMLALSKNDCLVFRNESAGAWVGKVVLQQQGHVTLSNAHLIHAGLCTGSSDIVGIHKPTGRFIAIEVKTPIGRVTKEQYNFLAAIAEAGGISGIARSVEEALSLLP